MTQYYIKNEDGEFVEADKEVEQEFKDNSKYIVAKRLRDIREKTKDAMREEVTEELRKEATDTLRKEITEELKSDFQAKIDAANDKATGLETQLRRKTIAAEYGFKADAEQFLGDGSEEDMRAKADALKDSFAPAKPTAAPAKQTKDSGTAGSFVRLCD